MWWYLYVGFAIIDMFLGFTDSSWYFLLAIVMLILARLQGEQSADSQS